MQRSRIPTLSPRFLALFRRSLAIFCAAATLAVVSPEASATEGYLVFWGDDSDGQKDEPQPQSKCTKFSSTYGSSFCLKEDGSIKGWGYDSYDQVSDIPSGTGFTDIAAACYAGFAVDSTGSIVGWGDDDEDAISSIPDASVHGPFTAVSAHCYGGFALNGDGEISGWGWGGSGSGNGSLVDNAPSGTGYTKIASSYADFALALDANGTITAWGDDDHGQISNAPTGTGFLDIAVAYDALAAVASDGSLVAWGSSESYFMSEVPDGNNFTAVACAYRHTCFALRSNGSIAAWGGFNDYGEISSAPNGTGYTAVFGGYRFGAAMVPDLTEGNLTLWGYEGSGQTAEPQPLANCTEFANTYGTSFCLEEDGSIKSWGDNYYGKVSGTPSGAGFIDVGASCYVGFAVDATGAIIGWGEEENGEISGIPDAAIHGPFTQVSGYCEGAFALNSDGEIIGWGEDYYDLLAGIPSGDGFTKVVSTYSYAAFALRSDGSIAAWGEDYEGLVSDTPTGTGFLDVGVSYYGAAAVAADGSLVAWGDESSLITDLPSGNDFTNVACTSYDPTACFALRSDGSIAAWGYEDSGTVDDAPTGNGYSAVFGGYTMGAAIKGGPAGPSDLPLAAQYDFTVGLADVLGGRDAIALRPRNLESDGYHFKGKQGLVLELCGVTEPAEYAFEIDMTLDEAPGLNDDRWSWQRLWSFDGEVSDEGMYAYKNYFDFYDESPREPEHAFTPGTPFTLRMERNAAGTFTAFLDGDEMWSFDDSSGLAIQSDRKQYSYVFTDDRKSNYVNDDATGLVTEIRVYGNAPTDANCEAQCSDTMSDSINSITAMIAEVSVPATAKKHLNRASQKLQLSLSMCGRNWSRAALRQMQRAVRSLEKAIIKGAAADDIDPIIAALAAYVRGEAVDKITTATAYEGPAEILARANKLLAKGDGFETVSRQMHLHVMAFKFGVRAAEKAE